MRKEVTISVKSGPNVLGQFADLSFATTFVTGIVNESRNVENFDITISKRTFDVPEPKLGKKEPVAPAIDPKKVEEKKAEQVSKKN